MVADNNKAITVLNWLPKRSLDEMCEDGWRWQINNKIVLFNRTFNYLYDPSPILQKFNPKPITSSGLIIDLESNTQAGRLICCDASFQSILVYSSHSVSITTASAFLKELFKSVTLLQVDSC